MSEIEKGTAEENSKKKNPFGKFMAGYKDLSKRSEGGPSIGGAQPGPAPQPFGIPWLDDLAGGLADGQVLVLLGLDTVDKTAIGLQIMEARAAQGSHTAYFCYETWLYKEIGFRILTLATGVPFREFERLSLPEMPDEIVAEFQAWRRKHGPFIHLVDMGDPSKGTRGVEDLKAVVDQQTKEGRRPTLLIVDSFWMAAARYMHSRDISITPHQQKLNTFASQFVAFCREERLQGILLHHLENFTPKTHGDIIESLDAAGYKRLRQVCSTVLLIPPCSDTRYTLLVRVNDQTQSDDDCECTLRLDPNLLTYDHCEDVVFDHRTGLFVPGESRGPATLRPPP
jgi:hypothetical protein